MSNAVVYVICGRRQEKCRRGEQENDALTVNNSLSTPHVVYQSYFAMPTRVFLLVN